MKGKRAGIELADFSGGQITNAKLIGSDAKSSPNCLNVYADPSLRKRFGIAKLNSSAVGTTPNGNGIFNWVINATQQYIMAFFGSSLQQMGSNGSDWSGTFATFGRGTDGTNISDGIVSSIVYSGNFIFTTENRDKPQVITTTATSYKNIDTGGVGTAPACKYLQVWKTHLWMLNIAGGGALTDECSSLSGWSDNDVGTGANTQTTFQGLSTFRLFAGGTAGDNSRITRVLSTLTTCYTVEVKNYFDSLNAVTSGDYAFMDVCNGVTRFRTRWSTDGLEIFDGTSWLEVGVNLVTTGAWAIWKFLVTAGTASAAFCDVYKDNVAVGLQYLAANASTASSGQIDFVSSAGASSARMDQHIDYIYVNSISPRSYYYVDGGFETWTNSTVATFTDNALPSICALQYRLNDNAATNVVVDNGSLAVNGICYASNTTINTSTITSSGGKINQTFGFASAPVNHVRFTPGATILDDTVGSFSFWFKQTAAPAAGRGQCILAFQSSRTIPDYLLLEIDTVADKFIMYNNFSSTAGFNASFISSTPFLNNWIHVVAIQDGVSPYFYVNGETVATSFSVANDKTQWFGTINGVAALSNGVVGTERRPDTGSFSETFEGNIDDVRYYSNKVLTLAESRALYNSGDGTESQASTAREGTTFYQGTFAYKMTVTGNSFAVVSQSMASGTAINGIASVFGCWCNVTNNATYKLRVDDGTSKYDTATLTGNGTWQYQTLSFTPVGNAGTVKAQMIVTSSATTAIFDMASVTPSSLSASASQDYSDRLQRTAVATYNDFSGTDSGSNDITTTGDVGLTGSAIINDKLYVFKRWSIHRVTYTGSTPLLDIKQAKSTVGTASPRSIKNVDIPGSGEVVIFLGTDRRLYMFDGYEATSISDNISISNGISNVYFKNINAQALNTVFGIYHSELGHYELFCPIGSETQPTHSIIVDLLKKPPAFWPHSNRNFLSGNVSDNAAGQRVTYVQGNTNGLAYLLDTGTNDDGSAINSYWTSFKQGSPVILSKIDEIEVQTDAVACAPVFSWRMDWETPYVTKTLGSGSYTHNFNPNRLDNIVQFKFADNSTTASFKLWSIGAYEKGLGQGK